MEQSLAQMAYRNLDGLKPSSGMLQIARRTRIYRRLLPLYLGATVDLPDESDDAVVASGVLTHGHAPPESLDGIIKLLRPGGVTIFSLSPTARKEQGFGHKIEQLQAAGQWQRLDQSQLFRSYPFSSQGAHLRHRVRAFRKN